MVAATLGQAGEQAVDGVDGPGPGTAGDLQVLVDREGREDAPALGDVAETGPGHRRGPGVGHIEPAEANGAGPGRDHAHDGLQQRGLPGAVATDDGEDLAVADVEVDAAQHGARAVAGDQPVHLEEGARHGARSAPK